MLIPYATTYLSVASPGYAAARAARRLAATPEKKEREPPVAEREDVDVSLVWPNLKGGLAVQTFPTWPICIRAASRYVFAT